MVVVCNAERPGATARDGSCPSRCHLVPTTDSSHPLASGRERPGRVGSLHWVTCLLGDGGNHDLTVDEWVGERRVDTLRDGPDADGDTLPERQGE